MVLRSFRPVNRPTSATVSSCFPPVNRRICSRFSRYANGSDIVSSSFCDELSLLPGIALLLDMVCDGLAAVAIHGFDVSGVCLTPPLWRCCGSAADGTPEIADRWPLPPALAWSVTHDRSQCSTAHACKMSCVVIKCVIWCKYVMICEVERVMG